MANMAPEPDFENTSTERWEDPTAPTEGSPVEEVAPEPDFTGSEMVGEPEIND